MKTEKKQQIDEIMDCLGKREAIEPSPMFADVIVGRIDGIRVYRRGGYRSRTFYPVIILLMALLNATAILAAFNRSQASEPQSYDRSAIMASEYGIGQSGYMN